MDNSPTAPDKSGTVSGRPNAASPSARTGPNRRRLWWCLAILACLATGSLLAAWYAHATVMIAGQGRVFRPEDAPEARVALVFGARVFQDGDVSWPLRWRLEAARDLYARGAVERILVSGDNSRKDYNEPLAMKEWLIAKGVPAERIACDYAGRRTLDSCARAVHLWDVREQAILVSQAYHLPRALFLAKSWGMDAVAVSAERGTFRRDLWRERLARIKAWLDVNVLQAEPNHWGPRERWPDER